MTGRSAKIAAIDTTDRVLGQGRGTSHPGSDLSRAEIVQHQLSGKPHAANGQRGPRPTRRYAAVQHRAFLTIDDQVGYSGHPCPAQ
jgi:phosphatidylserine/phosphatidylglycerophosphate/cardiolipin synthase-like enzyme